MAKPFSALPGILNKRQQEINTALDRISRDAATAAGRRAVLATRVDTGAARSNWRANLRSPLVGTIPPYAPGMKRGIGERANASAAQAQHKGVIQGWKAAKGVNLFIANNVDHISLLEAGGPGFAPGNMLGLAVQAWRARVTARRFRKILGK